MNVTLDSRLIKILKVLVELPQSVVHEIKLPLVPSTFWWLTNVDLHSTLGFSTCRYTWIVTEVGRHHFLCHIAEVAVDYIIDNPRPSPPTFCVTYYTHLSKGKSFMKGTRYSSSSCSSVTSTAIVLPP